MSISSGFVQLPDDAANTGKKEDHVVLSGGNYREVVSIGDPDSAGLAKVAPVDATNGLAVDPKTLPPGAATAIRQDTGNSSVANLDTNTGAVSDVGVTGDSAGTVNAKLRGINTILSDVWSSVSHYLKVNIQNATLAVTQSGSWVIAAGTAVIGHVIVDSGSITANAGTNLNTSALALDASVTALVPTTDFDSKIGSLTETAPATDTASSGLNGRLQRIAQRLSTLITAVGSPFQAGGSIGNTTFAATQATAASLNATVIGAGSAGTANTGVLTVQGIASMTKLLVTPDSVALPANQSVNVAQVGGTNSVTGGVAGTLAVGGNVATNVAIGTNPINNGAQAVSSENTAVTATRMAQLVCDLVGKLIVLPYSNPENFVSGAITSAMTGTTSTSLIAAPASGLRNYITQITVSNAHGTVGTDIIIQDGSGGTTLYTIPAAALYGGATLTFPTPLRQPTTATAIYCANVTTGASTKVSASGYKGA